MSIKEELNDFLILQLAASNFALRSVLISYISTAEHKSKEEIFEEITSLTKEYLQRIDIQNLRDKFSIGNYIEDLNLPS